MESLTLENSGSCNTVVVGNYRTETHPVRSDPSFGRSSCGNTLAKTNHEIVKVAPSRMTPPTAYKVGVPSTIVTADVTSPTAYKVGVPGTVTTTQSGTVQVIDLTRHGSSDAHLSRNGTAPSCSSQTRSLSLVKPQVAKDVVVNCKGKLCSSNKDPAVIAGNRSVSTPSKG